MAETDRKEPLMDCHPTLSHGYILDELAHLAETVDACDVNANLAMLFALTERFGVELGLAIKAGKMTQKELVPFLERTCQIASIYAGMVVDDTYGPPSQPIN
jgi:hypothetical protein